MSLFVECNLHIENFRKEMISMTYKKGMLIFFSIIVVVCLAVALAAKTASNFLSQFQSFALTIHNQSDYDIVSVETGIIKSASAEIGIVEGDSKDYYAEHIKSGKNIKIKPRLSLNGEGGIYLKYTDARGETVQKSVCSYTEYLSGYSTVTIHNNGVAIEEKCY